MRLRNSMRNAPEQRFISTTERPGPCKSRLNPVLRRCFCERWRQTDGRSRRQGFYRRVDRGGFRAQLTRADCSSQGIGIGSFSDLTNPTVKKVAVGNPKTVPAGQYTEQTLNRLKLLPEIQSKLILAEDVRQVLDYVVRDEVEAGVVYSSDALSAGDKVKVIARAAMILTIRFCIRLLSLKRASNRKQRGSSLTLCSALKDKAFWPNTAFCQSSKR